MQIDVTKDAKGLPMLRYNVDMPSNAYIGFCYGDDMKYTDMVAFLANTQTVQVQDLFGYGNSRPPKDTQQDYKDVVVKAGQGAGRFAVTASRLLDTGDKDSDSVIPVVSYS